MEKYEILSIVGEGSFGRVYKAKTKTNGDIVALKLITKCGRSLKEITCLRRECEIQQHLDHPNIIKMLDSFETDNEIAVVTEFAYRDLYEILGKEGYLSEERARKIICDLVSALYYLHSNRVLHRDLKPQNVLLSVSGVAKLCDFGFARNMSIGTHVLTSIKGTPLYMAPELMEENPYDHNADLWSLGCIGYEMVTGSPPFTTTSILHLVRLIRHEPINWPSFLSSECCSLLQGLLQKNPKLRLSWPHLLKHPFLQANVLLLSDQGAPAPLTNELTTSQAVAKETQKQELSRTTQFNLGGPGEGSKESAERSELETTRVLSEGLSKLTLSKPQVYKNQEECMDEIGGSPVEAEEWVAFLEASMEEVMRGDIDCVLQPGLVAMVMRALACPLPLVLENVASLFSLPFVVETVSASQRKAVLKVYEDSALVGKLVAACCWLVCSKRSQDGSEACFFGAELEAMESLTTLLTHLIHTNGSFVQQVVSSAGISSLLSEAITLGRRAPRLTGDVLAIMAHALRTAPAHASQPLQAVIQAFPNPETEVRRLLTDESESVRRRALSLLGLMALHSPQTLQPLCSDGLHNDIEALSYDSSQSVRSVAEDLLIELKRLPFYGKQPSDPIN